MDAVATGAVVALSADHPGFLDPAYRARRDEIARLASGWQRGQAVPDAPYTDAEHAVWQQIRRALTPIHAARAGRAYHEASRELPLPMDHIPQLAEVNRQLSAKGGYLMIPAAGLVVARDFLRGLGDHEFRSTQYIRHHSRPFYTPEPDVVHELLGHAATLAHPDFMRLNRLFGQAISRSDDGDDDWALAVIRAYWWTVEFGVFEEDGALKTCAAGLLSSSGELSSFEQNATLRPFSIREAVTTAFDPTAYQDTLFVAKSHRALVDETAAWLETATPV